MMLLNAIDLNVFEEQGFLLLPALVAEDVLVRLVSSLEEIKGSKNAAGMRSLLGRSQHIRQFAMDSVAFQIALSCLGPALRPVRAILFDKTPDANWYVTWHQDLTIPVKEKFEIAGFGPWSVKDDIVHVQPPAEVLAQMVSLRINLDDCDESNGAIKFLAGTHRDGVLDPEEIQSLRSNHREVICGAKRGDIIAMRPLIVHSSSRADAPAHRRVLHLEYAAAQLPDPLEWAEA